MKKKVNRRQRRHPESQVKRGHITKAQDQGAKAIFENPELMAQLLRDYVPIQELKNVKAEDIEDVSERFVPLNQEGKESDVIKRVHLKECPMFVISLVEHKAQVDFRAPFKMLQYMTLVWDDYEKEMNRITHGAGKKKEFRYPPILPIIYYEGAGAWTAAMNMKDRVFMSDIFGRYIPDFEYHLIRVHDYTTQELVNQGNELSLIMLINRLTNAEDFEKLSEIPKEYFEHLEEKSSEEILTVLSKVVMLLLSRLNLPRDEVYSVTDKIWKGEMDMLFDSFKGYDIQKVRRESREEGKEEGREEGRIAGELRHLIVQVCKKLRKGLLPSEIAEILEEDQDTIEKICKSAEVYAPEYNADKIVDDMLNSSHPECQAPILPE